MAFLWTLFNLLQGTVIVAWNVVWITLAAVATLFTWNSDTALIFARRWYARPILWACGGRLEEAPLPDVDWSKPHIFVMNHQSILDIPVAFAVLPANLRFVAKHSLKWIPFLGWYMSMTRMVFINRGKRHEAFKSLQEAGQRIREGANIIAYPEGTRSRDGRLLEFKKGIFVLAVESGVPVVPVVVEGSGRVWPSDSIRIRPGTIRVKVGQPIATAGRTPPQRKQLIAEVHQAMLALQAELQSGAPAQALPPAPDARAG